MTITQRFNSLLFGSFLCLVCLAGLFIFEMGRVYDSVNFGNANIVPSIMLLDDASRNFGRLRVRLYRHLLNTDPAKRREVENSISEARAELQKNLKDYTPLLADTEDRAMLANENAVLSEYSAHIDTILAASNSHRDKEALDLTNHSMPIAEKLNEALDAHIEPRLSISNSDVSFVSQLMLNA